MIPLYCSRGHENSEGSRFCRECGESLKDGNGTPSGSIVEKPLGMRYRVLRELGHGGFGRTYLAEDTNRFHEYCVLKEFAPQVQGTQALRKAEELFEREAGILYKLQHPQIPRFRELFRTEVQDKGRLFLVQDYVEGQTYQAILRTRRNLGQWFTESEVTQLLFQLLPVLSYIHACGVIHRDISPDNLILRSADGLPVLIDFGGVKQVAAEVMSQFNPLPVQTPAGATLLGKMGYAPEEQMRSGEVFPYSDLYALAITVLVLVTGNDPQALVVHRRRWQQDIPISPPLLAVLERMAAPSPLYRYQSAQEVLRALEAIPSVNLSPAMPDHNLTRPPIEHMTPPIHYPATIASTDQEDFSHLATIAPVLSHPQRPSRRGTILKLLGVAVMAGTGVWAGDRWLKP